MITGGGASLERYMDHHLGQIELAPSRLLVGLGAAVRVFCLVGGIP
jgi:hypothetical protein